MRLTWTALRFTRLAALALAVVFVLGAASVSTAQDKPTLVFQNDAGLIIFYVKPRRRPTSEELMTKLKDGLAKMEAPEAEADARRHEVVQDPARPKATVASYVLFADPDRRTPSTGSLSLRIRRIRPRPRRVREVAGCEGRSRRSRRSST
jgi:hypothetical protein